LKEEGRNPKILRDIRIDAMGNNVNLTEASYIRISKLGLGSSSELKDKVSLGGILNDSSTDNPNFYTYNKVKINYCDGTRKFNFYIYRSPGF
jgi:Pectinacetylesterase